MSSEARKNLRERVTHCARRRLIASASSSAETNSPRRQLSVRLGQPVHGRRIAHDLQGFLQRLQVLREIRTAEGLPTVAGVLLGTGWTCTKCKAVYIDTPPKSGQCPACEAS